MPPTSFGCVRTHNVNMELYDQHYITECFLGVNVWNIESEAPTTTTTSKIKLIHCVVVCNIGISYSILSKHFVYVLLLIFSLEITWYLEFFNSVVFQSEYSERLCLFLSSDESLGKCLLRWMGQVHVSLLHLIMETYVFSNTAFCLQQ